MQSIHSINTQVFQLFISQSTSELHGQLQGSKKWSTSLRLDLYCAAPANSLHLKLLLDLVLDHLK
jgi:hypothetical protein